MSGSWLLFHEFLICSVHVFLFPEADLIPRKFNVLLIRLDNHAGKPRHNSRFLKGLAFKFFTSSKWDKAVINQRSRNNWPVYRWLRFLFVLFCCSSDRCWRGATQTCLWEWTQTRGVAQCVWGLCFVICLRFLSSSLKVFLLNNFKHIQK